MCSTFVCLPKLDKCTFPPQFSLWLPGLNINNPNPESLLSCRSHRIFHAEKSRKLWFFFWSRVDCAGLFVDIGALIYETKIHHTHTVFCWTLGLWIWWTAVFPPTVDLCKWLNNSSNWAGSFFVVIWRVWSLELRELWALFGLSAGKAAFMNSGHQQVGCEEKDNLKIVLKKRKCSWSEIWFCEIKYIWKLDDTDLFI